MVNLMVCIQRGCQDGKADCLYLEGLPMVCIWRGCQDGKADGLYLEGLPVVCIQSGYQKLLFRGVAKTLNLMVLGDKQTDAISFFFGTKEENKDGVRQVCKQIHVVYIGKQQKKVLFLGRGAKRVCHKEKKNHFFFKCKEKSSYGH